MRKSSLAVLVAGALALCAGLLAATLPVQEPGNQKGDSAYVEWLTTQVGKTFSFYPGRDVAVELSEGDFHLTKVGRDFVTFESKNQVLTVPVSVLRVAVNK